jgi:hypothetical protein
MIREPEIIDQLSRSHEYQDFEDRWRAATQPVMVSGSETNP